MTATPEARAASFYFMAYLLPGAYTAFGGIWFAHIGMSSGEIGLINAVPTLVILLLNIAVGKISDRAPDWRGTIVIGTLLSAVAILPLPFASGFYPILILWTLTTIPFAAVMPVLDAASISLTKRNGSDFGRIRAWGTIGFLVFNVLTGVLIAQIGLAAFPWLIVALAVLRGAAAGLLPRFREPRAETAAPGAADPGFPQGRQMWFLLPLIAFAGIFATMGIVNTFGPLLWARQGISPELIGLLVGTASASEIAAMFLWRHIRHLLPARGMVLIAAACGMLRWGLLALAPPLPVIFFAQALHAVSFALALLAALQFIANATEDRVAAQAQAVFVVLQQVLTVVALAGFGGLFDQYGAPAYLVSVGLALLSAVCITVSMRLKPPQTPRLAAEIAPP